MSGLGRLNDAEESMYRELYSLLERYFKDDMAKASEWMNTPNKNFGGETPEDYFKKNPVLCCQIANSCLSN